MKTLCTSETKHIDSKYGSDLNTHSCRTEYLKSRMVIMFGTRNLITVLIMVYIPLLLYLQITEIFTISSRRLLLAVNGDNYRQPQQIRLQSCGIQSQWKQLQTRHTQEGREHWGRRNGNENHENQKIRDHAQKRPTNIAERRHLTKILQGPGDIW